VAELIVLRAGDGELVTDRPERTLRILTDHELLNLTWFRYEPGQEGPDPHVHYTHSDAFYVLEGELELRLGPAVESVAAPAGTLGAAPPNLVHTFRNSSEATAIFINVHAPGAGFADMMRARRDGRDEEADRFDQHDPPADGGRPLADALVTTPGESEARDPDGHFSVAEEEVAPGYRQSFVSFDPPPLTALFVAEGTIELVVDGSETELRMGDFALVPPGVAHALGNPSATPSRCLMFTV
jgi:mannose-6-phosphate isomerase-like protein (cupin superfamily)